MKRILKRILLGIPVVFTAVSAFHLYYRDGYRDLTIGRTLRQEEELFSRMEGIHKVRISLLAGEGEPDGKFPIAMWGKPDTYGSVDLTGADLDRFLELWRPQETELASSFGCHEPGYGFRLYRPGKAPVNCTVCWKCYNVYMKSYPGKGGTMAFNAETEDAKRLLEFCDKLLPYKREG
ncbi:MAG: hypothetical protein EOP85_14710 [Verrucomicrobiaceae bacterium]|nr:MAG: hypothetical protein EOP85_14710 [Verrucomicrobiaceae bacterium]